MKVNTSPYYNSKDKVIIWIIMYIVTLHIKEILVVYKIFKEYHIVIQKEIVWIFMLNN